MNTNGLIWTSIRDGRKVGRILLSMRLVICFWRVTSFLC